MKRVISHLSESKQVEEAIGELLPSDVGLKDIIFLCIGTDRSTGDALGPIVGTNLQKLGINNVVGTLHEPVHALNIVDKISRIPVNKFVIAIDASMGDEDSLKTIMVSNHPIRPGSLLGKDLPEVGHVSIKASVNFGHYTLLHQTRLSMVVDLAEIITTSIVSTVNGLKNGYNERNK